MIISVHLHKTAGTWLKEVLSSVYGEKLRIDYDHVPTHVHKPYGFDPENYHRGDVLKDTEKLIKGKEVIHGHFNPVKYRDVEAKFTTILRHPVDRTISHYLFAKDHVAYHRKHYLKPEPIYAYVVDMDLSVTDFASILTIKHFYSRTYFGQFGLENFDLIGDFNNIKKYLEDLGNLTGKDIIAHYKPKPEQAYTKQQQKLLNDKQVVSRLEELLVEDIELYEKWKGKGL